MAEHEVATEREIKELFGSDFEQKGEIAQIADKLAQDTYGISIVDAPFDLFKIIWCEAIDIWSEQKKHTVLKLVVTKMNRQAGKTVVLLY